MSTDTMTGMTLTCACGWVETVTMTLVGHVDRGPLWDHLLDAHRGEEHDHMVWNARSGIRIDIAI